MLKSIQHLRGYSAFGVAIFHIYPMFIFDSKFPIWPLAAGVDVFFVISGFIMWKISNQRETTPLEFILNRINRIVPPYWIATLILFACVTAKPNLFPVYDPSLEHLTASLAFIPHRVGDNDMPFLIQGWTLNYEMFFYAVFTASLFVVRKHRLALITAMILALVLIGLMVPEKGPIARAYLNPLLLEFLAGIYLAVAVERKIFVPAPLAFIIIPAAVLCIFAQLGEAGQRAIYWGGPSAAIVWSMVSLETWKPFPNSPALMLIGSASYSIYLTHSLAGTIYKVVAGILGLPVDGPIALAFGLLSALISGIAFHHFVEIRLQRTLTPVVRKILAKITRKPQNRIS
jgi:exopolysaccharide production protein ExoZ